jgi:hypothetical protein
MTPGYHHAFATQRCVELLRVIQEGELERQRRQCLDCN